MIEESPRVSGRLNEEVADTRDMVVISAVEPMVLLDTMEDTKLSPIIKNGSANKHSQCDVI